MFDACSMSTTWSSRKGSCWCDCVTDVCIHTPSQSPPPILSHCRHKIQCLFVLLFYVAGQKKKKQAIIVTFKKNIFHDFFSNDILKSVACICVQPTESYLTIIACECCPSSTSMFLLIQKTHNAVCVVFFHSEHAIKVSLVSDWPLVRRRSW